MSVRLEFYDEIVWETFGSRVGYVFTTAGHRFALALECVSDAVAPVDAAQAGAVATPFL